MSAEKKPPRVGNRPFADIIVDMADGDVERQLTNQLAEVVRACDATKKKGKLTLTINVAPGPKTMVISADVKATVPKPPLEAQQFYVDDKGSLHLENPRQTKMFDGPKPITATTNDPEN